MAIYPVIMCGGSGTRLWPASRDDKPKQFIPLIGERSIFQTTAARVGGIAPRGRLVVVAGVRHSQVLADNLATVEDDAVILLEPEARDSCAAMAAAAAWIVRDDPEGVALFLSADHYIPDATAFCEAAMTAAAEAASGRIVTFGVTPTYPATGFGYVQPGEAEGAVKPLLAFVEKPDEATARGYVAQGFLWNSGMFVARADHLLAEIRTFAPLVADAAVKAVERAVPSPQGLLLASDFLAAPRISIDYAVMEKTAAAAVLPVDFAWDDVGAWDTVWKVLPKDAAGNAGRAVFTDARNNLARAPLGMQIDLVGVENLAVVADRDAVLVCALPASQTVKAVGERMKGAARLAPPPFATLHEAKDWYDRWMTYTCLPLWWGLGADHVQGGFREVLDPDNQVDLPRRGRVQPRQIYSFAAAGALGWAGPWRSAVAHGLAWHEKFAVRSDGLVRSLIAPDGRVLNDEVRLYDQAFALLAYAGASKEDQALALLDRLEAWRHPAGGWRETGDHPFLSNPHMHLFEASLGWMKKGASPRWASMAQEIASLAADCLFDSKGGYIAEVYNADWSRAADTARVEPGHQFEWAWLLARYGAETGEAAWIELSRRLFATGLKGFDAGRDVAVDSLHGDLTPQALTARLWPQTEMLKASLILGEHEQALRAATGLYRYLDRPIAGAWGDRMDAAGAIARQPSPASTLYHLVEAWRQLRA